MKIVITNLRGSAPAWRIEVLPFERAKATTTFPAVTSLLEAFKMLVIKLPRREDHQIGFRTINGVVWDDLYLESAYDLKERFPTHSACVSHLASISNNFLKLHPWK
jgi:hypothetical protein